MIIPTQSPFPVAAEEFMVRRIERGTIKPNIMIKLSSDISRKTHALQVCTSIHSAISTFLHGNSAISLSADHQIFVTWIYIGFLMDDPTRIPSNEIPILKHHSFVRRTLSMRRTKPIISRARASRRVPHRPVGIVIV